MDSSEDVGRYPDPSAVSTERLDSVARSAGIVGGATLASRILGLLRDVVLAWVFGAGRATDAFFIAFTIPNLFRRLIGEGTLAVAFVPVFTPWLQRSREDARRVFNATWTLAAIVAAVVTVLGVAFAEPLARLFARGFLLEPGKLELCVQLLRLCFPYIFFLTIVAVAMGALNAVGHFFAPAIAPVLLNLCLIAGAGVGVLWLDVPILALGGAVIVAGALQVLIQIPPLRRRGLAPRPVLAPGHPAIRRLAKVMAPAVLGASVYQFNLVVVRFLSSFEGDGAVSYLYYADRLIEFPLGVFVFALGTASLPSFSRLVEAGDTAGLGRAFSGTLGLAVALALPSTAGLILLRESVFGALFSWNSAAFGELAATSCARALLFYAIGLLPITVSRIYVQLCIAHQNTSTPARAAAVSFVVNALASLALTGPLPFGALPDGFVAFQHRLVLLDLGFAGLALATSIAATLNAIYLAVAARRLYGRLLSASDWSRFARLAAASLVVVGVVEWLAVALPIPPGASLAGLALLAVHVAVGAGAYAAALAALRSPELETLLAMVRRRT